MVVAGAKPCRTMQLGLLFEYCPGRETRKAAAVLLAALVAAEYKTNDHFVGRRGSHQWQCQPRISITVSESKMRLQLVNVK